MSESGRFAFGKNWQSFLASLDEERIEHAESSLRAMLGVEDLVGRRFFDIGCGSGLFSLAAHRMGAEVVSIDYDADSVTCTERLRDRWGEPERSWQIEQASVLDVPRMEAWGKFDVVYSWGVLHHTGQMDQAIELAADRVAPGGWLFLALYNDQGGASRRWLAVKQTYHRLPVWLRPGWVASVAAVHELRFAAARLARGRNPLPFADWRAKKADRGMSAWHDWIDWVGGMPFEVASPERVIVPLQKRGFVVENLKTVGSGWGCNEYVFRREAGTSGSERGEE